MGAVFGVLGALTIGAADLYARRASQKASALTTSVALSAVAFVTSIAAVLLFGSTLRLGDLGLGLLSGLGLGIGLFTYYEGTSRSSSTIVSPIVAALTAVIPYGYAVARGASPSAIAAAGAFTALAGIVLISVSGRNDSSGAARVGVVWGLTSGVAYGLGFAAVLDASGGAGAFPAVGQRLMATVLLAAFALRRSVPIIVSAGARWAALTSGVLAGMSTAFYLAGIRADATSTVIATSMFPAVSVAVGRLFFADHVSKAQIFGIGVVLMGITAVVVG